MSELPKTSDELIQKEMSKEGANAIIELLYKGDIQSFIELAENSIHPGLTLVILAKKAERAPKSPQQPTDTEITLLATTFEPKRRMVDVACHIAMDPVLEEKFMQLANLIKDGRITQRTRTEADLIQAITRGAVKEKLPN